MPKTKQTLIALPKVKRQPLIDKYEVLRHSSGATYTRKLPAAGVTEPLAKLSDEEAILKIVKGLKSVGSTREAETIAKAMFAKVQGSKDTGIVASLFERERIQWRAGIYTVVLGKDAWEKRAGRLQAKMTARGKPGDGKSKVRAAEKREAGNGELRNLIQNKMRKDRDTLAERGIFDGCYVAFYREFKRELTPHDEDDPKGAADAPWLARAFPDSKARA